VEVVKCPITSLVILKLIYLLVFVDVTYFAGHVMRTNMQCDAI